MDARRLASLLAVATLVYAAPAAHAEPVVGPDMSCVAPAGDPAPGTPAWIERDTHNQYCAGLRIRDQLLSPAFAFGNVTGGAPLWVEQMAEQAGDPTHPRGGITTLIPGSRAADPFRTIKRWTEQGYGRVQRVSFKALDGATLRGHVFMPPRSMKKPKRGFPGVVITDGSVQGYQELYYWAAEDLASNGYMVMTYDVQGQGQSDLLPESCNGPGDCPGVPYQQSYNFYQGAEDSLSYFLSDENPYAKDLDRARVALAGHSLGASAVSVVGQCDKRVKSIVAWDNLRAIKPEDCSTDVTIPKAYRTSELINTPALGLTNDYGFWTQPTLSRPDPESKMAGYKQVRDAGLDAQLFAFRGATHLTYTYIPLVFQASELQERMASYYTLAWLDATVKGKDSGFDRLTAATFDASADKTSIGAGVYDVTAADPADPLSGNVPYEIAGVAVANAASFYYRSAYSLPSAGRTCADMRKGC